MTPKNKKFSIHLFWILMASLLGIGIGYFLVTGGALAYKTVFAMTKELIFKKEGSPSLEMPSMSDISLKQTSPGDVSKKNNSLSIGFVGDIVPSINASPQTFSHVLFYTEKPDIMIGNLEGAATSNIYFKCKSDSLNCFSFNGDNDFLKLLSDASFDVLNVANNHFNDYGEVGRDVTLKEIGIVGILPSGIKDQISYFSKNNLKVGIVGFSNYFWTNDLDNEDALRNIISAADQNADIVIVIFHGGAEGPKYAHTPNGGEWYLGENRGNVRAFAEGAVDAGADIVLGSGPHVLRGIEKYKGKIIAYSLGNFAPTTGLSTEGLLKNSAMIEITLAGEGAFLGGKILPIEIDASGIPHPDSTNAAFAVINNLSKDDFGKSGIILDSAGEIIFP